MKGISNHFVIWTLISWEIVRGVFFLSVVLYHCIGFPSCEDKTNRRLLALLYLSEGPKESHLP